MMVKKDTETASLNLGSELGFLTIPSHFENPPFNLFKSPANIVMFSKKILTIRKTSSNETILQ